MVRALLAGAKSQTRRIMKPQPSDVWTPFSWGEVHRMRDDEFVMKNGGPVVVGHGPSNEWGTEAYACPYGVPGDRLWVRETLRSAPWRDFDAMTYAADGEHVWDLDNPCRWAWKRSALPSIHMPRLASRITREITEIRVQRLQDISEEDALAEGVTPPSTNTAGSLFFVWSGIDPMSAKSAYATLWEEINGRGSWDANPWCWCVSFRKVSP